MRTWETLCNPPVEIRPDTRFLCSHEDFRSWAEGGRELTMEFFYREMRRRTGLLMEGANPVGGRWNYDAENRKPAKPDLFRPPRPNFPPDRITQKVMDLVDARFPDHMGTAAGFNLPVTREEAQRGRTASSLRFFRHFGETQDAMLKVIPS